ncbi:MAG: Holliday junction ATP-dependent DNA helicase RuvA [Elusimicrobia bacterium]|nr:Holliday junction ATP-dependent DNA helicase RuvA [Elusimicrobiota bacterium]
MIASLRGAVLSKTQDSVVLEVAGVGYEVSVTPATASSLPEPGRGVQLHIAESVAMYGGGVTLYGFMTPSDKEMFLTFRDCVPSTGAKKALEYLDKASRSLPDFRRAVLDKDAKVLTGVFGFTRKTAERLIDALKDEIEAVSVPGAERLVRAGGAQVPAGAMNQALSGLAALGYRSAEARAALLAVAEENAGEALDAERIIRLALKRL